jgi:hypothetical protein
MSVSKGQTGNSSRGSGDEGTKTTGKSQIGKMAKRIKTPDLCLSKRNLRKIQTPSSVLQASMLLFVDGEDENEGEYTK